MRNTLISLSLILFGAGCRSLPTLGPDAVDAGHQLACIVCQSLPTSSNPQDQAQAYAEALRSLTLRLAQIARDKGHNEEVDALLNALTRSENLNRQAFERLLTLAANQ